MARIGEAELERLKAETSLVRLVEASGIKLEKRGKDLVASCPFHDEDMASFVITPQMNLFHCFGCGAAGGPVDWVMKRNGVSFRHAVELLRDGLPSVTNETVKRSTVRALPPPVTLDSDDQALLDHVIDYYHETLKKSPEALAYLERRGIGRSDAVQRFKLGFADRTLGLRLPDKQRKEGAAIRGRLAKIGLYRDSGHEHFNGSLIIPVLDEGGHVTEVYGRKITEGLRAGTPLHLYLPGPHKGVWNLDGLKQGNGEVILCEALIDALTFWVGGFRNVTAAYGVEGLTQDHITAFKRFGVKRVLIAFDRDEAGERGTAKVAGKLMAEGIDCFRILFPKGLDANEYALKLTPASKSLGLLIRKAEWLGQGAAPVLPTSLPVSETMSDTAPVEKEAAKEKTEIWPEALPEPEKHESSSSLAASSLAGDDPLPARVQPSPPHAEAEPEVSERGIAVTFGDRRYRVRGFERNLAVDVMKVNLLAAHGDLFHVDTFDLYSAKARTNFIQMAAGELRLTPDTVKSDVGRLLLQLEGLQDQAMAETLAPKDSKPVIDTAAHEAALAYLRSPNLLTRIGTDFEACGLVGETTNKLVAYLAAVSRKLAHPLAVLVQSSSAAGKSSLMDAVLAFVPEDERVRYSALTGQALFYMGEHSLKHRILAISEEEGAARASYALKLLQSEGEITIASTAKDDKTGQLVTQEYRVEGPVMIFLTTTAIAIDEELMNRCLVLGVDEGRAQTQAIHHLQRKKRTLEGLMGRVAKDEIIALHRNAQRLLRPLAIVNPYADRLSFLSDKTRTRRDHEKYLTLIDAIALLHQHQREVKRLAVAASEGTESERIIDYIEVTLADIEAANRLAHEVLGRLIDELPPQTRSLLNRIAGLVSERSTAQAVPRSEVRFTRRELREITHMSDTQVKVHLARLVELEYLLMHRSGQGQNRGMGHVYELVYDGDGSVTPHLSGLIDVESLRSLTYDGARSGVKDQQPDPGRGLDGARSAVGRTTKIGEASSPSMTSTETVDQPTNLHILQNKKQPPSHIKDPSHTHTRPPASSSLAASSLAAVAAAKG
jgi:DNA primase